MPLTVNMKARRREKKEEGWGGGGEKGGRDGIKSIRFDGMVM